MRGAESAGKQVRNETQLVGEACVSSAYSRARFTSRNRKYTVAVMCRPKYSIPAGLYIDVGRKAIITGISRFIASTREAGNNIFRDWFIPENMNDSNHPLSDDKPRWQKTNSRWREEEKKKSKGEKRLWSR